MQKKNIIYNYDKITPINPEKKRRIKYNKLLESDDKFIKFMINNKKINEINEPKNKDNNKKYI